MRKKVKVTNYKKFFRFIVILAIIIFVLFKLSSILHEPKNEKVSKIKETSTIIKNEPTTIHMAVIGDIMSHSTNFKKDYDFSNVFKNIKSKISDADVAIGNLETTFAGAKRGYSGYPTFSTPDALAYNLKDLGIDLLSTANNHCMDKGYTGLTRTLDILDKVKIEHAGTSRNEDEQNTIIIKEVNGIKIAFLSYTYGTNGITVPSDKKYAVNLIDKELIKKHIDLAKKQNVDLICVNMHWGIEYQLKENKEQDNLADFLFENGVDCIFGSHPHVLQPMKKRTVTLEDGTTKDGFVIYSLGNFMSGQIYPHTKSTVILDIQVTKDSDGKISLDSINYTPVYLNDKGAGAKSRTRYTMYDIEKSIADYDSGKSNISKSLYSTLKTELKSIKNIVGRPITK